MPCKGPHLTIHFYGFNSHLFNNSWFFIIFSIACDLGTHIFIPDRLYLSSGLCVTSYHLHLFLVISSSAVSWLIWYFLEHWYSGGTQFQCIQINYYIPLIIVIFLPYWKRLHSSLRKWSSCTPNIPREIRTTFSKLPIWPKIVGCSPFFF